MNSTRDDWCESSDIVYPNRNLSKKELQNLLEQHFQEKYKLTKEEIFKFRPSIQNILDELRDFAKQSRSLVQFQNKVNKKINNHEDKGTKRKREFENESERCKKRLNTEKSASTSSPVEPVINLEQKEEVINIEGVPDKIEEFIITCLQKMKPSILRNSFGRSKGADSDNMTFDGILLEVTWQMEFYSIARSILNNKCYISADVGSLFDTNGKLDFYVNSNKKWLIELVRESDRLQEHWDRFDINHGKYRKILKNAKALIDFCEMTNSEKELKIEDPDYWMVLYNSNYTEATIKRFGKDDVNIQFMGDMQNSTLTETSDYISCFLTSNYNGKLRLVAKENSLVSDLMNRETFLRRFGTNTILYDTKDFEIDTGMPLLAVSGGERTLSLQVVKSVISI